MRRAIRNSLLAVVMSCATANADEPAIDLEVATDPKAPFAAQKTWYDLLKDLDVASLRVRSARHGEEPEIKPAGSEPGSRFRIVALLDAQNLLRVPGGQFTQRDLPRFRDYLRTLGEEGIDGVTSSRGKFGLTERQWKEIFDELSEPTGISTSGKRPREIADLLADRLDHRFVVARDLVEQMQDAEPIAAELEELSRGTVMAIILRQSGLQFRPRLQSGELLYHIEAADSGETSPRRSDTDRLTTWPVGWEPNRSSGRTAPQLFEIISAEIEGYTLQEALEAILPRLEIPVVMDQHGIAAADVEPSEVDVRVPRGRYSYAKILSRILYQAELKGTLRVDERGTPFYWISPLKD